VGAPIAARYPDRVRIEEIPTLGRETRLRPAPRIRCREVGGEAVLLDLGAGTYFGLNATGTVIWRCVEGGASLAEAEAAVTGKFDIEPQRAWADLVELVANLLERGLVVVESAGRVTG